MKKVQAYQSCPGSSDTSVFFCPFLARQKKKNEVLPSHNIVTAETGEAHITVKECGEWKT